MYTEINNTGAEVYDGPTNKYLGKATFQLSQQAEEALLSLLNNGKPLGPMIISNIDYFLAADDYIPTVPGRAYRRYGILTATVKTDDGVKRPMEVRAAYDFKPREGNKENPSHVNCAEMSNFYFQTVKETDQ